MNPAASFPAAGFFYSLEPDYNFLITFTGPFSTKPKQP